MPKRQGTFPPEPEPPAASADTALRLARFFSTTPGFWLNLQQAYDVETEAPKLAADIARIEPYAPVGRAA